MHLQTYMYNSIQSYACLCRCIVLYVECACVHARVCVHYPAICPGMQTHHRHMEPHSRSACKVFWARYALAQTASTSMCSGEEMHTRNGCAVFGSRKTIQCSSPPKNIHQTAVPSAHYTHPAISEQHDGTDAPQNRTRYTNYYALHTSTPKCPIA